MLPSSAGQRADCVMMQKRSKDVHQSVPLFRNRSLETVFVKKSTIPSKLLTFATVFFFILKHLLNS
jgi:hypothetical protein